VAHVAGSVGSEPAGIAAQTPSVPFEAHERQPPAQLVAQQTPCAQKAESHSEGSTHAVPRAFFPHDPPTHANPFSQSKSVTHDARHWPADPQRKGAHDCGAPGTHAPSLQRAASVRRPTSQLASWQIVPAGYFRQWPSPSQAPSVSHALGPRSTQAPRGFVPAAAGAQTPSPPGSAQVTQAVSQAVWQQTPSAQKPLRQSVGRVHAVPSGAAADRPTAPGATAWSLPHAKRRQSAAAPDHAPVRTPFMLIATILRLDRRARQPRVRA
jgi:hypothetical protein